MELVSVITPNYNSEKYIRETIESVIRQTYQHWEMIIVDDGSRDNCISVINTYLSDPRIKLYRQPVNQGPVAARNKGIEMALGRYIAFLDSDDAWAPEKLEKQVRLFETADNAAIVFADYDQMDESGNPLNKIITAPAIVTYASLLKTNYIGCLTAVYDQQLLGKRYFVNHGHEDYILWLSILREGYSAYNTGEVLARYRKSQHSLSGNKLKAATWQWSIYRNVEKLNLFKSTWLFCSYFVHALKKHL